MQDSSIHDFYKAYNHAFSNTPDKIIDFYNIPFTSIRQNEVSVFSTKVEIKNTFSKLLEFYKEKGFSHSAIISLETRAISNNSNFITATYAYKNKDDITLWESTFSYILINVNGNWKIALYIMH